MKTIIHVWSKIGNTPLTGRKGAYCDELAKVEIETASPEEAHAKTVEMLKTIPHAEKGHYYLPDWWNQNTRSNWLLRYNH